MATLVFKGYMEFFCPVCQQSYTLDPETTVVTKQQQTVYKAHCPTCSQDMAAFDETSQNQQTDAN